MIKFKIKLKNWYFHGGVDKVAAFLLGVALGKKKLINSNYFCCNFDSLLL